ncbi:MAG: hypothetical protein IPH13_15290 [Planctomycetes bacterium]|nr:hypothetical protein [Planctomycetota bacterium]MCC7172136.1 hypothetical protein [Planctomycetota bacterium]
MQRFGSALAFGLGFTVWFASNAGASVLVVDPSGAGGAFMSLQAALDAAAPNDVIHVKGGTYVEITIAKPVTIVGDPMPTIRTPLPHEYTGSTLTCPPAITLAGPGTGTVTLVDVKAAGFADASFFAAFDAMLAGGGFTSLRIVGGSVTGPDAIFSTGVGPGAAAIKTSIPLIHLASTTIVGGENTTDVPCALMPPFGPLGIDAPNSTIVVLDSVVRGGRGSDTVSCFGGICGDGSPPPCPCAYKGGYGGDGIRAQRVYVSNSLVTGGPGMLLVSDCAGGVPWGQQPDGAPYAPGVAVVALNNDLTSSPPLKLGGSTTLQWNAGVGQLLVLSTQTGVPLDLAQGRFFLEPTAPMLIAPIASGVATATLHVPSSPVWIGVPLVAQVFDATNGLTRPVIDMVRP